MLVTLFCILAFVILVRDACIGHEDGNIRHPFECVNFISCSNEVAYVFKCPAGLHFVLEDNACLDPIKHPCDL